MIHHVACVTREQVQQLVDDFYADVRADPLLGPVFARSLHRSWPDHLVLMTNFWCTALKLERSFRGNVYGRHVALTGVTRDHLLRWLGLWRLHTERHLPLAEARRLQDIAVGMSRVLHLGWFDALPSRRELVAQLDAVTPVVPGG